MSDDTGRKPHVRVPQNEYLRVLAEVGGTAILDDIAEHLDVSTATARRALDGLAHQGKVAVQSGRNRAYALLPT